MSTDLVRPFPPPPRLVSHALDRLADPDAATRDPAGWRVLDRPWDPAGCSPQLRARLWPWLDDVAAWLNHDYAWQTVHTIPGCWPAHPHLVHELAVLACLRAAAADAPGPQPLEDWHRYALPGFCQRMTDRLGPGCPPGRHTDWPARSWYAQFTDPPALALRHRQFTADAGTTTDDPHADIGDEEGSG